MKTKNGSTLGLVMILTLAVGIVVAGVTGLVNFQRTSSVRRELHFQANNLAETALDYAFAFISNEVKRNGLSASTYVPKSGWKDFPLDDGNHSFAKTFLVGSVPGFSGYSGATTHIKLSDIKIKIGAPMYADAIRYIVPTDDPVNRLRAYRGQQIYEQLIPVIARATVTYGDSGRKSTAYIRKNIALNEVPMFQKAITYQGQLHMHRSFPIIGGVHTNGNLALHVQASDSSTYTGMVSCVGKFYRGSTFDQGGSGMKKYGYCPETPAGFLDTAAIKLSSVGENLSILAVDPNKTPFDVVNDYEKLPLNLDSRKSTWREDALTMFAGNLLDQSHGVGALIPPGCTKYTLDVEDPAHPNKNEFNNGTYGLIEPCVQDKTNPAAKPGNIYKFERQARLVFRVECIFAYANVTSDPTTDDTTADCYKWIVKPYAKMVGAETDGSTAGDWTPLPLPPGVIGQTKVQTFPTAGDQYEIATCIADFDSNINGYVNGSTYTNRKLQGLFEVYRMGASNVIETAATNFPTREIGTIGTGNYFKLRDFDRIVYEASATGPADWTKGSGKVKAKIQTSTPRTSKNCGYDFDEQAPARGFFNARLGRGVAPITINMARLKEVLDGTDTSDEAEKFRSLLGTAGTDYNGVIYVEFPTSMRLRNVLSPRAYKDATAKIPYPNDMAAIDSYAFEVGSTDEIEKRHPDRVGESQDATTKGEREDNIIPIAKGLRGYPATESNSEIQKAKWAIPALQIVNCRKLPKVGSKGLTISTNGPLYVVGSYNSDGDFSTGTNITGKTPTSYATPETGEISAGLFGETLTILSDTWGLPKDTGSPNYSSGANAIRFTKSFLGETNNSVDHRKVTTGPVEISACIIAGEYPIFEFFFHALENWKAYYDSTHSPICIKGAVVGMFHTEIQHFKKAYSRSENEIVEEYWHAHGAHAIPAVRLHENLTLGIFPPGTPLARDYGQRSFTFLSPGLPADKATLTAAGL